MSRTGKHQRAPRSARQQTSAKPASPGRARGAKPGPDAVNNINSGLMLATCAAAYVAPFHLFLLAYAVLGPLHYLTQISWMHDRQYFAGSGTPTRWWFGLVAATMLVLVYGFVSNDLIGRPVSPVYEITLVYLVLGSALVVLYVRRRSSAAVLIGLLLAALWLSSSTPAFFLLAYFLVTIVHVLVFTAAFILCGALRTRSASGFVSLAVFCACTLVFFAYAPGIAPIPDWLRAAYAFFEPLNAQLMALLGSPKSSIYESEAGITVMRLIAFAYTYHYLNWFSKTSVIGWHEIPRSRAVALVALWLVSLGLYAWSYTIGLAVLYAASLLHVLLEFPLDWRTFVGIGQELCRLARGGPPHVDSPAR